MGPGATVAGAGAAVAAGTVIIATDHETATSTATTTGITAGGLGLGLGLGLAPGTDTDGGTVQTHGVEGRDGDEVVEKVTEAALGNAVGAMTTIGDEAMSVARGLYVIIQHFKPTTDGDIQKCN